jgi:hypothetical protein
MIKTTINWLLANVGTLGIFILTLFNLFYTRHIVKANQEMVESSNRPEVIAYFYLRKNQLVMFKVKNIGKGLALNTKINLNPTFDQWTHIEDTNLIGNEIKLIAPNQELETYVWKLDELKVNHNNEYPKMDIIISYEDTKGKKYNDKYNVNLKDYAGMTNFKDYNETDIAKP